MLISDHTGKLLEHVDELEQMGNISEGEALSFRRRIDALREDMERAYDNEEE